MKLTKKKAVEICIELWTWLAETGGRKDDWPGWKIYGEMQDSCPLCEYSNPIGCVGCPYYKKFGCCCTRNFPYDSWGAATEKLIRKDAAHQFLEQLKQL